MSRGRTATSPDEIPAKGWKDILWRVKEEIGDDNVGLMAAGIAFYGLLALFPGIAALMALAALIFDPATITEQLSSLSAVLPGQAQEIIVGQAEQAAQSSGGAGSILATVGALLVSIWAASKGVGTLALGIAVAYDEEENRGFIKHKIVVLALTVAMMLGGIGIFAMLIGVPAVLSFLDLGDWTETLAIWLRWPIVLLVAAGGIAVLYRYGPDRDDAKWRWTTPGAAVACALWIVGTAAFALYVRSFASYNETFGALAGVVILLMWLWLSAYAILIGAELDSEMEAQTRKDTTEGPREPMGERGAVKADRLGESQV